MIMGRIKIKAVKSLAHEILRQGEGKFVTDFSKNKQILAELVPFESKKIRNVIAGYITKDIKRRSRPQPVSPPSEIAIANTAKMAAKTGKRWKRQ